MRIVRWMCGIKLQDRVSSKGLRERDKDYMTYSRYYSKTGCNGMGVCYEKKTMIG